MLWCVWILTIVPRRPHRRFDADVNLGWFWCDIYNCSVTVIKLCRNPEATSVKPLCPLCLYCVSSVLQSYYRQKQPCLYRNVSYRTLIRWWKNSLIRLTKEEEKQTEHSADFEENDFFNQNTIIKRLVPVRWAQLLFQRAWIIQRCPDSQIYIINNHHINNLLGLPLWHNLLTDTLSR